MKGHKFALGLIFVLIASGCVEMSGSAGESPSFEQLSLDVDNVERVTGADYSSTEGNFSDSFVNVSSAVRKVDAFFTKDNNLSKAPDSVKSMVVALNSSSEDSIMKEVDGTVDIDGYEAQELNSTNKTLIYGDKDNISFIVQTEGGEGFYSSAKELYTEIAEKVDNFENSSS